MSRLGPGWLVALCGAVVSVSAWLPWLTADGGRISAIGPALGGVGSATVGLVLVGVAVFLARKVSSLLIGEGAVVGERLLHDKRVPLISATGSVRMGREIGKVLADRLGRGLMELGGNNGILVTDDADLDLALRAVLFAAVGTAGQRCTTTRRLFLQKGIAAEMKRRLVDAYKSIRVGDPLEPGTLMGPLIDETAVTNMLKAIDTAQAEGGKVLAGGKRIDRPGFFVEPTLIEATVHMPITCEETFAPILYVMRYRDLDEVIEKVILAKIGRDQFVIPEFRHCILPVWLWCYSNTRVAFGRI